MGFHSDWICPEWEWEWSQFLMTGMGMGMHSEIGRNGPMSALSQIIHFSGFLRLRQKP